MKKAAIEEIYKLYPNKVHKSEGMKRLAKSVKTEEDLVLLKEAVNRYNKFMSEETFTGRSYLDWSTFCGRWRDWAEHEPQKKSKAEERAAKSAALKAELGIKD